MYNPGNTWFCCPSERFDGCRGKPFSAVCMSVPIFADGDPRSYRQLVRVSTDTPVRDLADTKNRLDTDLL